MRNAFPLFSPRSESKRSRNGFSPLFQSRCPETAVSKGSAPLSGMHFLTNLSFDVLAVLDFRQRCQQQGEEDGFHFFSMGASTGFGMAAEVFKLSPSPARNSSIISSVNSFGWPSQAILPSLPTKKAAGM